MAELFERVLTSIQTILSGEQKAMAEKQDALLSLAAEGDRRVAPKDQSAVCQSLLTVGFPDCQLHG